MFRKCLIDENHHVHMCVVGEVIHFYDIMAAVIIVVNILIFIKFIYSCLLLLNGLDWFEKKKKYVMVYTHFRFIVKFKILINFKMKSEITSDL